MKPYECVRITRDQLFANKLAAKMFPEWHKNIHLRMSRPKGRGWRVVKDENDELVGWIRIGEKK